MAPFWVGVNNAGVYHSSPLGSILRPDNDRSEIPSLLAQAIGDRPISYLTVNMSAGTDSETIEVVLYAERVLALSLPADRDATPRNREELAAFLPGLTRDLSDD